jgi:hypothetical protein
MAIWFILLYDIIIHNGMDSIKIFTDVMLSTAVVFMSDISALTE